MKTVFYALTLMMCGLTALAVRAADPSLSVEPANHSSPQFHRDARGDIYIDWPEGAPLTDYDEPADGQHWSYVSPHQPHTSACYKDEKDEQVQAVYDRGGRVIRIESCGLCGSTA